MVWCLERRLGYQESPGMNMMRQLSHHPRSIVFSSDVGLRGQRAEGAPEGIKH